MRGRRNRFTSQIERLTNRVACILTKRIPLMLQNDDRSSFFLALVQTATVRQLTVVALRCLIKAPLSWMWSLRWSRWLLVTKVYPTRHVPYCPGASTEPGDWLIVPWRCLYLLPRARSINWTYAWLLWLFLWLLTREQIEPLLLRIAVFIRNVRGIKLSQESLSLIK